MLPAVLLPLMVAACTALDCPLNSLVRANYRFYRNDSVYTLTDTLTVRIHKYDGNDNTLINLQSKTDSLLLPLSFQGTIDTLYFEIRETKDSKETRTEPKLDTIYVSKKNIMHFESVDCAPSYFHEIDSVRSTHNRIDTVIVTKKDVTYETLPANFQIHLK